MGGYTAAKNTPYAAVSLNKYGIKTATPAPTPIPDQIEQYSLISGSAMKCETTSGTHSVTVVNPLKIDLVVRTCDKYDPVSGAPCTGNMLKPNHYIDCPQNIAAGASTTFSFNGDTQYIAFTDAAAHTEVNEMWPSPVGEWPKSYTVKPAAVSVAFDICDPAGTVHAFGTDGNDKGKCLEIDFGGGKGQSHFWQKDGWKYSSNKVWSDGKCDRTAFPTVSSFTKDFGGWTAAKNSDQVPSCGNVNFTKYNPAAKVEAEFFFTGVPSMFVHQIVTSPGDHCLEITIPGGAGSPFWKANSWKYSAPDRPEWKTGACDHTKWDEVDSTTENYDGYTAAKNTPYAAVSLNKYGIKTATPAPTPIPDQVEAVSVAFDICDPTGVVHAFGTDGNDKGKCLEITFGGGKSQSHFWQKDGWKYSTNKVWSDGKCDRTTFPTVSSMTKDFGGWTAATNSDQVPSCGNVNFTKYNPKAVEVEAKVFFTGVPSMFVHQIVTS